jgi:DNA-binding LacI/PurR family transcriptional regulator
MAGLHSRGQRLDPDLIVVPRPGDRERSARELLSRSDRPDGIIALWRGHALAVKRAADALGLAIGRDFELVGWCPEELYEAHFLSAFAGGAVPPAVVWSVRTMAETAFSRLAERQEHPNLPALKIKVPVRLRIER